MQVGSLQTSNAATTEGDAQSDSINLIQLDELQKHEYRYRSPVGA